MLLNRIFSFSFEMPRCLRFLSLLLLACFSVDSSASDSISGQISLPAGKTAMGASIEMQVSLCAYDAEFVQQYCVSSTGVSIQSGASSTVFNLDYVSSPNDASYEVTYACLTNCDGYFEETHYLFPNGTWAQSYSLVEPSAITTGLIIELIESVDWTVQLSLPGDDSATSLIRTLIYVCTFSGNVTSLGCVERIVEIGSGQSSSSQTFPIVAVPENGFTQVNVRCLTGCFPYIKADAFYNFNANEISGTAEFSLSTGTPITGSVSLPVGQVANDLLRVNVVLCAYGLSGTGNCQNEQVNINPGQTTANFQVVAPTPDRPDSYTVSMFCESGCGSISKDRQYLQNDWLIGFDESFIDPENLPDSVDFVMPQGRLIVGNVSLSNGEIASSDIYNSVQFCAYDSSRAVISCDEVNVTILEGQSSGEFSLAVRLSELTSFYRLSTSCSGICGVYQTERRYLQADGSIGYDPAFLIESELPNEANFVLDEGFVAVGTISLPTSFIAESEISTTITFCSFDEFGVTVDCDYRYGEAKIEVGQSETQFEISVRPAPPGGSYTFRSQCYSNCGLYLESERFLQSDGSFGSEVVHIDEPVFNSGVSLELIQGLIVSGNISLPNAEVAAEDIANIVEVCSFASSGETIGCNSQYRYFSIPSGSNSVNYQVSIDSAPPGGHYRVSTRCSLNCDDYISGANQYLQHDLSYAFTPSHVLDSSLPSEVNFMLSKGVVFSGQVELEDSGVTSEDIEVSAKVCRYDSSRSYLGCSDNYSNISTIESGQSSTAFSSSSIPVPSDGFYVVSLDCWSNCGEFFTATTYLQADGSVSEERAFISAGNIALSPTFILKKGVTAEGQVVLPGGGTAEKTMRIEIELCSYIVNRGYINGCRVSYVDIDQGENAGLFSISIIPPSEYAEYRLRASCLTDCGEYLSDFLYLQGDGSTSLVETRVLEAELIAPVEFTLTEGRVFEVTVELPSSALASDDVSGTLKLCSFDSEQQEMSCNSQTLIIKEGESQATEPISILEAPDNGFYQLSFSCFAYCAPYSDRSIYLQSDSTSDFLPVNISSSDFTGSPLLTFKEERKVIGDILVPNNVSVDTEFAVNIALCALNADGTLIDGLSCTASSVLMTAGASSKAYEVVRPVAPSDGFYRLSLSCSYCGPFGNGIRYLQQDLALEFSEDVISSDSLPDIVDITLLPGRTVNVTLSFPDSELAPRTHYTHVQLCSFDKFGRSISCDTRSDLRILAGRNSVSGVLAVSPAPQEGFYKISMSCSSCVSYLTNRQHYQADQSISYFDDTFIPSDLLPDEVAFVFDKGNQIVVELELPNNELASSKISNNVELCAYDGNRNRLFCSESYYGSGLIVASDNNSGTHPISVVAAPEDGYYSLSVSCQINCVPYDDQKQYLQPQMDWGASKALVPSLLMPENIRVSLLKGRWLSGEIALAGGLRSPSTLYGSVAVCAYSASGQVEGCETDFVSLNRGALKAIYQTEVPPASQGGYYEVVFRCLSGCEDRLTILYLQSDLSVSPLRAQLLEPQFPQHANFELQESTQKEIELELLLPNSEFASQDFGLSTSICALDALGQTVDCVHSSSQIGVGLNRVITNVKLTAAPEGGAYTVTVQCTFCAPFLNTQMYLQPDLTFSDERSEVEAESMPSSLLYTLDKGVGLSGEVSLPNGEIASDDMEIAISFCAFSSSQESLGCVGDRFDIFHGSNQRAYELNLTPAPAGGYYRLLIWCSSNCGGYSDRVRYLNADGGLVYDSQLVGQQQMPDTLDILLEKRPVFKGELILPSPEVAASDLAMRVSVCSYDSNQYSLSCHYSDLIIDQGEMSLEFELGYDPAPADGYYSVSVQCNSYCDGFETGIKYLSNDLSLSVDPHLFSAPMLPDNVSIPLISAKRISGEIRLPNSELATEDLVNRIYLCSYSADDIRLNCQFKSFTILEGTNSTSYGVSVNSAPAVGGYYRLEVSSSYLSAYQYLNDDLVLEFSEVFIPQTELPDTVNITLLKEKTVSGMLRLPSGAEPLAGFRNSVTLCSFDSSKVLIACSSETQTFDALLDEVPYDISIKPAPDGGYYSLSSRCLYGCGTYLSTAQYLQEDLSVNDLEAHVLAAEIPETADFIAPLGKQLRGNIRLSGLKTFQENIDNKVGICSFNGLGEIIDCSESVVTIYSGDYSEDFFFDPIKLASNQGFYQIFSECEQNCFDFKVGRQYLQPDDTFAFDVGNVSSSSDTSSINFVLQSHQPDEYEEDDDHLTSTNISAGMIQQHNLHDREDQDWYKVVFDGRFSYTFRVTSDSSEPEITIELMSENLGIVSSSVSRIGTNSSLESIIDDVALQGGIYYLRIYNETASGVISSYDFHVSRQTIIEPEEPEEPEQPEQPEQPADFCFPIRSLNDKVALVCM